MKFGRMLVWINCWLFVAFGIGFALVPQLLASLVTGEAPSTGSAVTDMRATYGGMALGLAVMFGLCAGSDNHVRLGLSGVLAVMSGLALARTLGMYLDGSPNIFMFALLGAEVVMGALVLVALQQSGRKEASNH